MSLFTRTFPYAGLVMCTSGTLATINHEPDPYCLLLARSTNHKNLTSVVNVWFDRRTIRLSPMVRSSYVQPDFITTNLILY